MSNELTLTSISNGDIVDPNTTKIELLETKFDEVEKNLLDLAENSNEAVTELTALAKASQLPEYYEALAKLIVAAARVNKEADQVINSKRALYKDLKKDDNPVNPDDDPKVVNNTLVLSHTELLDQILNKNK